MSDIAVRVENLSKEYRIGAKQQFKTLGEVIADSAKAPLRRATKLIRGQATGAAELDESFWALRDINFDIHAGEVVGIIGRNGAGKSTLLKILTRITRPTIGRTITYGRVASLLEVGTGFHQELTGRENVYLNGSILGMKRHEIDHKFDEIVDFAGVERFIDTPVKHYSSGMTVRLAFAVAAHLETEILLIDEVLAVGDIAFQKKSLGKMEDLTSQDRTVLFVSHNMAAVENLCTKAYLLQDGQLATSGPTSEVIDTYLESLQLNTFTGTLAQRTDRQGSGRLRLTNVRYRSAGVDNVESVQSGRDVDIIVDYEAEEPLRDVQLSIGVRTINEQTLIVLNNQMAGQSFDRIAQCGSFVCSLDKFPLAPGRYNLNLYCEVNGVVADWVRGAANLDVDAGDFFGSGRLPPATHGGVLVPQQWAAQEQGAASMLLE